MQALEQTKVRHNILNVGLNKATGLNDLIAQLGVASGTPLSLKYEASRSGDIKHSRADNGRLLESFTLPKPTTMAEGLSQLLNSL